MKTTATMLLLITGGAHAGDCTPPANETCDGAIPFTSDELPYHFDGLLGCENDVSDKPYWDVFFRYDCTIGGEHVIDMCDSDRDTYLRVYAGGCEFGEGEALAEADDDCPGSPPPADPRLVVELEAGVSYWIELGTWRPNLPWGAPNLPYVLNVDLSAAPCDADIDEDGTVDFADLLLLLADWGPCPDCPSDINEDDTVDFDDLLLLLGAWGPC